MGSASEMNILNKEKEFKWISCPRSSFHPMRTQDAPGRECVDYEWNSRCRLLKAGPGGLALSMAGRNVGRKRAEF
ncbi:MAG: hypothetical protein AMJ94_07895 [Deltaproteobacteria bacterium SM23_61]|nr:MAG: hypothetical protein AMJ94_07895 [Deltaproteobacteria bacterium SM23_61]